MQKVTVSVLCLLGSSALLQAADRAQKPEFGVAIGVADYIGELDSGGFELLGDLNAHWWLTDRFALGLRGTGTSLSGDGDNGGFTTSLNGITGRMKWLPFRKDMFLNPYLTAGIEWATFNAEDQDNEDQHPPYHDFAKDPDTNTLAIPLGLGVMHHFNDNWALNVEGLYHLAGTDYLDDFEDDSANDAWITLTAGLSFFPGGPKDSDGDGLLDRDDKCPKDPEDKDGFQDTDGCPDPDNDGDGVMDVNDGCPNDAEDKDGYKDADGCPDPDNDGDGILDTADKCPNDAEDKDSFQDEDGCPDPDNDADGVLDVNDKCPNDPETANGYKDEDGCPDSKPEIQVEAGKAIILKGINFDSGKATLTADSEETLNKVLRTLNENPEIELEVRGYTDNQGREAFNRTLSQNRADAVKAWLVERGIDGARLSGKGFGPDNPVADNATEEGRAQNRRIEFFRLK